MASAVRKLTGVGGDIRKIARLLQKEAPPGHMLAYINQEEADLLKARGGSGEPHADTGVPSFEDATVFDYQGPDYSPGAAEPFDKQAYNRAAESGISAGESGASPSIRSYLPSYTEGADSGASVGLGGGAVPTTDASIAAAGEMFKTPEQLGYQPGGSFAPTTDAITEAARSISTPRELGFQPGGSEAPTTENQTTATQDVKDWWKTLKPDTKARLGIGGIEAVIGAYQTSQAMEQARKYREDIAKTAQPYQQQGKELIAKAQSGELSPAAQQTLQAAQAQAAQGAQSRGGVGAQQAQAQVEGLRQQLLQQQYDYGLKVLGIGDSIAVGAIKAGMQADQYVNQLASNYTMNIARTVAGTPTYVDARQSGVVT